MWAADKSDDTFFEGAPQLGAARNSLRRSNRRPLYANGSRRRDQRDGGGGYLWLGRRRTCLRARGHSSVGRSCEVLLFRRAKKQPLSDGGRSERFEALPPVKAA